MSYNLVVKNSNNLLAGMNNNYFFYEDMFDSESIMVNERNFYLKHSQIDQFASVMGKENSFYLHRVFLSYYEASERLNDFWDRYAKPDKYNLHLITTFSEIESFVNDNEVQIYNTFALSHANYFRKEGERNALWIEPNSFQEYLWANNMNNLLESYNFEKFHSINLPKGQRLNLFDSGMLYKYALEKSEISSVLYEWAHINSINQADFVKRISNILELIKNDLHRNKEIYDTITKGKDIKDCVYSLNNMIQSNTSKRNVFFGIFNASNLLGPYSRHFSAELIKIQGINNTSDRLEQVLRDWKEKAILPSNEHFKKLFNCWYVTTAILLINWLRLTHLDTLK